MEIPSKLIQEAVDQFSTLPGIGNKTALRLALHLLNQTEEDVNKFGSAFISMRSKIQFCEECHNVSESEICSICASIRRDDSLLCVVENLKDLIAIERTSQFRGKYHVLGGVISPMDGIGPQDLKLETLIDKCKKGVVKEAILALPTTMEGDTTNFFIFNKIKELNVKVSIIARGVSIGDEIEYTDEITLGKSIENRTLYEANFQS